VKMPSGRKAATARNFWQVALKAGYTIDVQGSENLPKHPPLLVIVNEAGPLTSPIIRSVLPWPVHHIGSDIAWSAPGIGASWAGSTALREGRSVAVSLDLPTAGALALMSGLPIACVRITGAQGRINTDPARPGSRITVSIAPVTAGLSWEGLPTAMEVRLAHTLIRQRYADVYQDELRDSA